MEALTKSKFFRNVDSAKINDFNECVFDLIQNEQVKSMKCYIQHGSVSTYSHCQTVSFISFLVCRMLKLDYCSAARGGILHDLYLYDWHLGKPYKGWHGLAHPTIALQNANQLFDLNDIEKDIIKKHMWPLTLQIPRYRETFVVLLVDKLCASAEVLRNVFKI